MKITRMYSKMKSSNHKKTVDIDMWVYQQILYLGTSFDESYFDIFTTDFFTYKSLLFCMHFANINYVLYMLCKGENATLFTFILLKVR